MKYQFHNLDLSHNQQASIVEHWEKVKLTLSDALQTCVESSMKVSFGWDNYHDCLSMSLTTKDKEHPFYGYVVSVKHQDLETLIKVMSWLDAGNWDKLDAPGAKEGRYSW